MTTDFSLLSAHPTASRLLTMIDAQGFESRFVGGCVRDMLLGKPIDDIDLATTAMPDQVMEILKAHNVQVIPTGLLHGTVTAVLDGQNFEITTLRHDMQSDGRHAKVSFHDDWALDAERRDFTINAMSIDRHGLLHDYFDGVLDIQQRFLRFINDAEQRITEDYLRLLRYFRFAAVLDWALDPKTLNICSALAPHLKTLSRERVQNEIYKLLLGAGAKRVIQAMTDARIWRQFIPEAPDLKRFEMITKKDAFLRLIALTGWQEQSVLEKFIVLTREQKKRLQDLNSVDPDWPLHKLLYVYGLESVTEYQALHQTDWVIGDWRKPIFPLTAEHVMPLTGGPGKRVGEIMKQAESWWIDREFQPDLAAVLKFVRQI